jgi:hypothetical protein
MGEQRPAEQEQVLHGGVANAGAVVRIGDEVRRPSNPHTTTIHALLRHVRAKDVDVVPQPFGVDDRGRERLGFIEGDVAVPPFPAWSLTDVWLSTTAQLIRRLHDATVDFTPPHGATWSDEMADASGVREVICHNDVCPENVVARQGRAVGLLDFDFAAPGRRVFDLAAFATMCVPIDTDDDAALLGRAGLDVPARLRLLADAYGLDAAQRTELLVVIGERVRDGGQFVLRRVQAGEPAFIQMWTDTGGMARYDRRRAWFAEQRPALAAALG